MSSENQAIDVDIEEEASENPEDKKAYEPWNDSYSLALLCAGIGTLMVWAGVVIERLTGAHGKGLIWISVAIVAVGIMAYTRGANREFGKAFEEKNVKRVKKLLDGTGYKVLPPRMTRVGDIDLLVEGPTERLVNVEIKSWRIYGTNDKYVRREKKAINQIHSQRGAVEADVSILWLPQGKQNLWQWFFNSNKKIDDDVYLCCGNAKGLRSLLRKIAK